MIEAEKKIEISESELMDYYIMLVEKDIEILKKLQETTDLKALKEVAKQSLKLHERMDNLARLIGLDEEDE